MVHYNTFEIFCITFIISSCFIIINSASSVAITGYMHQGSLRFKLYNGSRNIKFESEFESFIAVAHFEDYLNDTGWTILKVSSSEKFPDVIQGYWSGYAETSASFDITIASWYNTAAGLCPKPFSLECEKLQKYLASNIVFMIEEAYIYSKNNEFWYQVLLQLWQLKGMADAFNGAFVANATMLTKNYLLQLQDDVIGFYLLQLSGDLYELSHSLDLVNLQQRLGPCHTPLLKRVSCSALIKLVRNNVYISHVTWSDYCQMLRVLKQYDFPWKKTATSNETVPGRTISFSSYPSVISSIDDFYVTSGKLVTLETTNGNHNESLWSFVRDGAQRLVLEPFRVMAANRLATSGPQWVEYFRQRNSGTYNNQWMIFDAKLYSPAGPLPDKGLLTVAEQIPGRIQSADVTNVLREQTYWPSYNLPYFPDIYNESGFPAMRDKYGDIFDYSKTARAVIFARDHAKIKDFPTMYKMMRYNDYTRDPVSKCDCTPPYTAHNAISARGDLNDPNGSYPVPQFAYRLHGGIDVKMVDHHLIQSLNMLANSGPTYDQVPPFDWSKLPVPVEKPRLQPTRWTFKPIVTDFVGDLKQPAMFRMPSVLPVF